MHSERKFKEYFFSRHFLSGFSKSIRTIIIKNIYYLLRSKGLQSVSNGFSMCFKRVSKEFPKRFKSVLKAFQKGFQSVLKGFPKSLKRVSNPLKPGFTGDLKPPRKRFCE